MNLIADLVWLLGAALSLGFIVYGAFLLFFVPRLVIDSIPARHLRLARS